MVALREIYIYMLLTVLSTNFFSTSLTIIITLTDFVAVIVVIDYLPISKSVLLEKDYQNMTMRNVIFYTQNYQIIILSIK